MRSVCVVAGVVALTGCAEPVCSDWPGGNGCGPRPFRDASASASGFDAGPGEADAGGDAHVSPSDAAEGLDGRALDAGALDATPRDANTSDATSQGDALAAGDASPAISCSAESPASANGVRVHVEGDSCNFAYGQGGTFRYRVELERPVPIGWQRAARAASARSSAATCGR